MRPAPAPILRIAGAIFPPAPAGYFRTCRTALVSEIASPPV